MVKITVVYDNNHYSHDLKPDWGFACVIETPDKTILFDTGADGSILLENMKAAGINVSDIDVVVISHNHYDHTGGLCAFLIENPDAEVMISASFPESFKSESEANCSKLLEVKGPQKICDGVFVSGEIEAAVSEQCLIVKAKGCSVVITGCAHPGIVQMVEKSREIVGNKNFFVLGGFHLYKASRSSLDSVVNQLEHVGVVGWGPCHCSGDAIREILQQRYQGQYFEVGTGKVLEFD